MTTPVLHSTPTSVYRYYDSSGVLLYVGITKQGIGRNRQHNATKDWWQYVASQSVEHFDTRGDAQKCEAETIQLCRPPFNKHHNPEFLTMNAAYLAHQERVAGQVPVPGGCLRREQCQFTVDVVGQCEDGTYALRSRVMDIPATSRLEHAEGIRVLGNGRRVGGVCGVEKQGPLSLVFIKLRGDWWFDSVELCLRPVLGRHPVPYQIKHVTLKGCRRPNEGAHAC